MPVQKKHSLVDYDFSSLSKSTSNKNIYQRLMILAYLNLETAVESRKSAQVIDAPRKS